jgi:quinol monooxygenase YgiN
VIIIAGYSLTDADQRDAVVAAFTEMVARARQQENCLDLSISADSIDPERINVFELWRDQPSLDSTRKVAKPPKVKFRKTSVKLYQTDQAEKPF